MAEERRVTAKTLFLGFAGMIAAAAIWSIWGDDETPADQEGVPSGSLYPGDEASSDELRELIAAHLRPGPRYGSINSADSPV
ncbi:hypothetical protein KEM55_000208 [Ascosphaera atra]|nr:hypothetical protein KEM55_000208 [Ascosphaera atra]